MGTIRSTFVDFAISKLGASVDVPRTARWFSATVIDVDDDPNASLENDEPLRSWAVAKCASEFPPNPLQLRMAV